AKDFDNAKDLVAAWMNSPNHKANILNSNYQDIGIAVVMGDFKGEETILIVQMFGTEFTPGEQYAVEQTRDNVEFKTTELLQASKIPWEKIVNDKFFLTKVIAMSVFLGFTITIFINLFSYYILKKPKPRKRQIWGHLIFLITFGILIILTSDGNII
ncbi:hypothetical protein GYA19_01610, partial [Candidatus Beckwithbacteria bacterium]|nr:hypothetical protein [Candidatus Beckwithbacteria bacterium]